MNFTQESDFGRREREHLRLARRMFCLKFNNLSPEPLNQIIVFSTTDALDIALGSPRIFLIQLGQCTNFKEPSQKKTKK